MVEMSQLSGASMTPCGWVKPVVGGEDFNGVSQHTVSCGPCKDLIVPFAVMLKPIREAHFSGEMLSIGISYVVITSICSEKTHLKTVVFQPYRENDVFQPYRECYRTL